MIGAQAKFTLGAGIAAGVVLLGAAWWAKGKLPGAVAAVGNAINPLNHDNIFATTVNDVGAAVTGNKDFSLGVWAWEITHPGAVAAEAAAPVIGATWVSGYDLPQGGPWAETYGGAVTGMIRKP